MKDDEWQKVKQIFADALECEASQRSSYVRQACGSDTSLRQAVEALLASHETPTDFLAPPTPDRGRELLAAAMEKGGVGRTIGPYRTIEQVGTGGMGAIYRAVRVDEEFEQQVAIKLIKPGIVSKEALRRFRQERQTMAHLQHPHIARLLDGGTAEDGSPYLAMEYVEGKPIDQYCDEHTLSVPQRLELFRQMCSAVHYAHQNLIVHRDLKPRNVLVTADGVPKLLDFGISKLLEQDVAAPRDPTVTAMRVMTPQYASPEQIRGDPITTASDVYSLGVILYELLTGHRPYHVRHDQRDEATKVICEVEPDTPSDAISHVEEIDLGDGTTSTITPELVGKLRGELPERLRRRVRGDLDTIVMTAMHKDPQRRYASVEQFSEDIQRYLDGLPVRARRDTFAYRAGKFIRRRKAVVVASTVAGLALIAGTIGTSIGMLRAQQARREAEAQTKIARTEARKAERINEFLQTMLASADPGQGNKDITVREVLDRAAERVEAELTDELEVRAAIHSTIGQAYKSLGSYENANSHLLSSVVLHKRIYGNRHRIVGEGLRLLGNLRYLQGDLEAAEQFLTEAVELFSSLQPRSNLGIGAVLNDMAIVRQAQGRFGEAEQLLGEAFPILEAHWGAEDPRLAQSIHNLASLSERMGDYEAAEKHFRRAIELHRASAPSDHPDLLGTMDGLAKVLRIRASYEEAESLFREVLDARRRILGEEHPEVGTSWNNLALVLHDTGALKGAEMAYRQGLSLAEKSHGEVHSSVAAALNNLGLLCREDGRYAEAEEYLRKSLALRRILYGEEHPAVATCLNNLGLALQDKGEYASAESALRQALELRVSLLGEAHPLVSHTQNNLAVLHLRQAHYAEAEDLYRRSLKIRQMVYGQEHPKVATVLNNLGSLLREAGDFAEAERCLQGALTIRRDVFGHSHRAVARTLNAYGLLLKERGDYTEAERLYRDSIATYRALDGSEHSALASALHNLAVLNYARGEYRKAESGLQETLEMKRRLFGSDHPLVARTQHYLGLNLCAQARFAEAVQQASEAVTIYQKTPTYNTVHLADALRTLALGLAGLGDYAAAETQARDCQRLLSTIHPDTHWRVADAKSIRGACLTGVDRFEEAEPLLVNSYSIIREAKGDTHKYTVAALNRIIDLYDAWGKPDKADEYRALLPLQEDAEPEDAEPEDAARETRKANLSGDD